MQEIMFEEERSYTSVEICGRMIGLAHSPFIVAELSANHNQSLARALELVEAAEKAGADAIKLQSYTADTMTIDKSSEEFFISDPNSLWHGKSLYQLYEEAHMPWHWHAPIFARARELGLIGFSTPFDETAVDYLESLDVPVYKIASFENTDLPLIRRVARTGKPVIISTGLASVAELDEAVRTVRAEGCQDLVLLKTTSAYPALPTGANLRTIYHMRQLFGCEVGLSDHTLGVGVAAASVAFGASIIEKHFTLSRADGGVDAAFSLEPNELRILVEETERAWQAIGTVSYEPSAQEQKSIVFRRSLYVVRDLEAGEVLTRNNVRSIRPGKGLPPKYIDQVVGRCVNRSVERGTALTWDLIT